MLKSPSTHIEMDAIYNSPNKAIDTALEVGHEYIVMAWLSESERQNIDQYREYVDIYNLLKFHVKFSGSTSIFIFIKEGHFLCSII